MKPIVARQRAKNIWIGIGLVTTAVAAPLAGSAYLSLHPEYGAGGWALALLAIAGILAATGFYAVAHSRAYTLTLNDQGLEIRQLHRTRRIPTAELIGWRPAQNGDSALLYLHYGSGNIRRTLIPVGYLDNPMLAERLRALPNLDLAQEFERIEQWLSDDRNGRTREQRLAALVHQKRVAYILNFVGLPAAAWYWIRPQPYDLALWTNLLLPAVAVAIAAVRRDRWSYVLEAQADPKPRLHTFYLLPIAALLARAVNYRIVDQLELTIVGLSLGGALFVLICALIRPRRLLHWNYAALFLVTAAYGYGATTHLNARLDFHPGEQFIVNVMAAHDYGDEPEVTLSPWGPYVAARTVESGYPAGGMPEGSKAEIWLYPGLFGIRWWTLFTAEPEAATGPTDS